MLIRMKLFLDLTIYYREFTKKLFKVVTLIFQIISLRMNKCLNEEKKCKKIYDTLNKLLSIIIVFKHFEFDNKFEVYTTASGFVIRRILMQDGHLVAYESCNRTGSSLRWLIHKE